MSSMAFAGVDFMAPNPPSMAVPNASPDHDGWTGLVGGNATRNAIRAQLNDPDSLEIVSSYKPWPTTYRGQACWETKVIFRAKNAFGGKITSAAEVYLLGGDLSQTRVLAVEIE